MTEQEMREKVIYGLEWALENMVDPFNDFRFAGYDGPIVLLNKPIVSDALALLEAQEPKLVTNIHKEHNNILNPNVPWVGKCPKCGKKIEGRNLTRFCKFCGRAVKWE